MYPSGRMVKFDTGSVEVGENKMISVIWLMLYDIMFGWSGCVTAYFVIGIDTNIEVIVVSLTTWEAHHSPRAKPEGCGEFHRSLMRQQWSKLKYQFLFYRAFQAKGSPYKHTIPPEHTRQYFITTYPIEGWSFKRIRIAHKNTICFREIFYIYHFSLEFIIPVI